MLNYAIHPLSINVYTFVGLRRGYIMAYFSCKVFSGSYLGVLFRTKTKVYEDLSAIFCPDLTEAHRTLIKLYMMAVLIKSESGFGYLEYNFCNYAKMFKLNPLSIITN